VVVTYQCKTYNKYKNCCGRFGRSGPNKAGFLACVVMLRVRHAEQTLSLRFLHKLIFFDKLSLSYFFLFFCQPLVYLYADIYLMSGQKSSGRTEDRTLNGPAITNQIHHHKNVKHVNTWEVNEEVRSEWPISDLDVAPGT